MAVGTGEVLSTRVALLAKLESTYGSDPTLAAADAMIVEGLLAPEMDQTVHDKPGLNSYAIDQAHYLGRRKYTVSVLHPLFGSGTLDTAPEFGPILQACGFKETVNAASDVTYTPDITDGKSVALESYLAGSHMFQMLGCRGVLSLAADEVGAPVMWTAAMTGLYAAPTATALVGSEVYDSNLPPVFMGGSFTFGTSALLLRSFTLDMGTQLAERPNFADANGYKGFSLTKHAPTGSMVVELEAVADWNPHTILSAGTTGAIDITIGSTVGNKWDIDAPVAKLDSVSLSEDVGIVLATCNFRLTDSSGNDFLTLKHY